MPPNLDVYVLPRRRDLVTINEFINKWVDREASEQRDDESLTLYHIGKTGEKTSEDEPAISLTNIIARGLSLPRRAFWVYLKSIRTDLYNVVLGFTNDNRVVYGASIDDANENEMNLLLAKQVLKELAQDYEGEAGLIGCEEPPPIFPAQEYDEKKLLIFKWNKEED